MAAKADKKGMKRICTGCGTHFYDFERRPIVCPSCDLEFTGEAKVKTRRVKAPANDAETSKAKPGAAGKAPVAADEDDIVVSDDADVISLDDVEETDDMDDDDDAVKIDLGEDDIEDLDDADIEEDDDDLDDEIDVDIDKD